MFEEYADFPEQGRHFTDAMEQFDLALKTLIDEKSRIWEHGDIEQWLLTKGSELLSRLLQGHFDICTESERVHD